MGGLHYTWTPASCTAYLIGELPRTMNDITQQWCSYHLLEQFCSIHSCSIARFTSDIARQAPTSEDSSDESPKIYLRTPTSLSDGGISAF